jgi:hypothetical protein
MFLLLLLILRLRFYTIHFFLSYFIIMKYFRYQSLTSGLIRITDSKRSSLTSVLDGLSPRGSTNMIDGLKSALSVLKNFHNNSDNNNNSNSNISSFSKRVILLSGMIFSLIFFFFFIY